MDLFVGGLPLDLGEVQLRKIFEIYGIVIKSAKIIKDRTTGFYRGFGFVTIEDKEEAQRAISKFNGQFVDSSRITVKEARARNSQTNTYSAPRKWQEKTDCEGAL